jgi:hypothetical protein
MQYQNLSTPKTTSKMPVSQFVTLQEHQQHQQQQQQQQQNLLILQRP